VVVDAGLGTIIDDKGMFWHNGGNIGFRSLYVGDPVSRNGMAAMTNGDKGEEVRNALRQRVATAYGWSRESPSPSIAQSGSCFPSSATG
jgi:Beta-lactamase